MCHVSTFLAPLISNSQNASNNPAEFTFYQIYDPYSFITCMKTLFLRKRMGDHGLNVSLVLFSLILYLFYVTHVTGEHHPQISGVFKEKSATV